MQWGCGHNEAMISALRLRELTAGWCLVRSSLWGEQCSGQGEQENKGGWVSRCDPGNYQINVGWLERTVSSSQFKLLVGIGGGSDTVLREESAAWLQ